MLSLEETLYVAIVAEYARRDISDRASLEAAAELAMKAGKVWDAKKADTYERPPPTSTPGGDFNR